MSLESAILLGIIQGLTEFLPVSSSGHLVLAQSIISDFEQPGVLFDVILHLGTTLAVLFYFRKYIRALTRRTAMLIIIGSIPAVVVGVLFQDLIETLFVSTTLVGFTLLITAFMNWRIDKSSSGKSSIDNVDALVIGIAQAIAIFPGISRSGATIFAGVTNGVKREEAAYFSFILSVPVIMGASFIQIVEHGFGSSVNPAFYLAGFIAASATGLVAIAGVLRILVAKRFSFFALYCTVVGLAAILF